MSYTVRIQHKPTGEVRAISTDWEWGEGSVWAWTEGNFGCDCNRGLLFYQDSDADCEITCNSGDNVYAVIDVTLPNGRVIPVDEA